MSMNYEEIHEKCINNEKMHNQEFTLENFKKESFINALSKAYYYDDFEGEVRGQWCPGYLNMEYTKCESFDCNGGMNAHYVECWINALKNNGIRIIQDKKINK